MTKAKSKNAMLHYVILCKPAFRAFGPLSWSGKAVHLLNTAGTVAVPTIKNSWNMASFFSEYLATYTTFHFYLNQFYC